MGETYHGYGTFFNPTSTTMKKSLALTILCLLFAFQAGAFNKNTGTVGNTVCFVRFADEDASIFEHTIDTYQNLFNVFPTGFLQPAGMEEFLLSCYY